MQGTQKKSLATFVKFADSLLPKLDATKHIEIRVGPDITNSIILRIKDVLTALTFRMFRLL